MSELGFGGRTVIFGRVNWNKDISGKTNIEWYHEVEQHLGCL